MTLRPYARSVFYEVLLSVFSECVMTNINVPFDNTRDKVRNLSGSNNWRLECYNHTSAVKLWNIRRRNILSLVFVFSWMIDERLKYSACPGRSCVTIRLTHEHASGKHTSTHAHTHTHITHSFQSGRGTSSHHICVMTRSHQTLKLEKQTPHVTQLSAR